MKKLRRLAILAAALALPLGPVVAQPSPQPASGPAFTTLRARVESVGHRPRGGLREVYATLRVQSVSGPNPTIPALVALAQQPNPASPPQAVTQRPAFQPGQLVRLVYVCSLDRASPMSCTSARNHPAALAPNARVTLSLVAATVRSDEVPVPEARSPRHDVPFVSTQGPTFRLFENGAVGSVVLEVFNGDPGELRTTPGAMVVP